MNQPSPRPSPVGRERVPGGRERVPPPSSWSLRLAIRPEELPGSAERGFASVIVLILMFVMITLLLGNNRLLHLLKQDLQRIEERQVQRAGRQVEPAVAAPVVTTPDTTVPEGSEGKGEGEGEGDSRPVLDP